MSNNVELMFTHQSNIEIPKWISYTYNMYFFWDELTNIKKYRDRIKKSKRKSKMIFLMFIFPSYVDAVV